MQKIAIERGQRTFAIAPATAQRAGIARSCTRARGIATPGPMGSARYSDSLACPKLINAYDCRA